MAISKKDAQKMQRLAQEGKQISKIVQEDFPKLYWWEVRGVLEEAGTSSSLGLMREISRKLNKVSKAVGKNKEHVDILLRVQELARQLYYRSKEDYKRLDRIRKAVEG